jgi:hypothetical protein
MNGMGGVRQGNHGNHGHAQDLGGNVVWSADGNLRVDQAVIVELVARPEIREASVAITGQENVVGLHIAVDVAQAVHRVDRKHHLCDVKLGNGFRQPVLELAEQCEKIAARVVLHEQVQGRLVLRVPPQCGPCTSVPLRATTRRTTWPYGVGRPGGARTAQR